MYNESLLLEKVITQLIRDLRDLTDRFEVIISENGSTDGSARIADNLAAQFSELSVIHAPLADYGRALQRGLLAGKGQVLTNFSVDLVDLDFLRTSLPLLQDYDIVLGSKYLQPRHDRRPRLRHYPGLAYHWLVNLLLGLPVRDTHGIKVFVRERVASLIARCTTNGLLFDTELILRAHRQGLLLIEVPLVCEEIRPTRMKLTRLAFHALIGLIRLRIALLMGRF